ncbi:MAG: nitronate monooxygenase [Methylobacteriaceae bacterium]|nr:nitronate monooxygenase [Methylobacteriaceae bacterium]
MTSPLARAANFCERFGLRVPILLAPMAGACPASLSIAVAKSGGMGAAGALLMSPAAIAAWMQEFRSSSNGAVQLNLWIPDPPPQRDTAHEGKVREFLGRFGPPVPENAGDSTPPDFTSQCEALLAAGPAVVSSIMGLYSPDFVARLKERGIVWFATATTVAEALAAEAAGADVVVAQGAEAGGHRGAFEASEAERCAVGLFALLPAIVGAVRVPVVATGGIGDGRGVAAALALGASAAQVGTAFLRCPEAKTAPAWADALANTKPEDTVISRAFSGRPGRSIATDYARATLAPDAPTPAPYPVQRGLTAGMREAATKAGDVQRMQVWAGQSAALARAEPADEIVNRLWDDARKLLA